MCLSLLAVIGSLRPSARPKYVSNKMKGPYSGVVHFSQFWNERLNRWPKHLEPRIRKNYCHEGHRSYACLIEIDWDNSTVITLQEICWVEV